MRIMKGAALAFFVAAGCGHATTTGSAQNDWTTPTGQASATNPRVVDPNGGMQPARNRSVFAQREAPTLQPQPQPSDTSSLDIMPPPDERAIDAPGLPTTQPAPDVAGPELAPPDASPNIPPFVTPEQP